MSTDSRTHVSLNVADLGRAVDFRRTVLGVEPGRHNKDYAKFELDEPPLVLSLEPVFHRASDSFNHLGLRLGGAEDVRAMQERLGRSGVLADREDTSSVATRGRPSSGCSTPTATSGRSTRSPATSSIAAA
jgi:catechol 2,3-dioxygenase-like lactoylglutathione lyase family enzyme